MTETHQLQFLLKHVKVTDWKKNTETFFLLGLWGVTWSNSSAIFGGSFQRHVRIFCTRPLSGAHYKHVWPMPLH